MSGPNAEHGRKTEATGRIRADRFGDADSRKLPFVRHRANRSGAPASSRIVLAIYRQDRMRNASAGRGAHPMYMSAFRRLKRNGAHGPTLAQDVLNIGPPPSSSVPVSDPGRIASGREQDNARTASAHLREADLRLSGRRLLLPAFKRHAEAAHHHFSESAIAISSRCQLGSDQRRPISAVIR